MKMLMCGLAMSLGVVANDVAADQIIHVDGEDYLLSALTENCQSITGDPAAQIACFGAISELLNEQSGDGQDSQASVAETLGALRELAQYQDDDTGLSISGADCTIHIVYFNNYFHISRRNVSTIDLFSAQFDVSKLQFDQIVQVQGGQAPLSKATMVAEASAVTRGGQALDSTQDNFSPRSPRTTIDAYANEVVSQLPSTEGQTFDFVLVHPKQSQSSDQIWTAFEAFVNACQS